MMTFRAFELLNSFPLLKVLAFFLIWVVLWLPVAFPLAIALKWHPSKPITPAQKLPLLASLYLLAPLVLWGAAASENRSFAVYGLPLNSSILVSFAVGLICGTVGLLAMFSVQKAFGWVEWRSPSDSEPFHLSPSNLITLLLSTLLIGVGVSLIEELIFRGFLVNQFQTNYSPWIAAAIASLIFAVLHLVWEGADNIPQLPGLWLMGMVLVLSRWVDGGNLGLAWGLHSGWIWAIASLDSIQLFSPTKRVPEWITGIEGKPLAGSMGILFLLATAIALWLVH